MEHVLTEEQQTVIDRGVAAGRLLQDPTFNSVLNQLAGQCLNGITATEPKEVKKREDFYFMHLALQAVHGELRARVATALELQESLDESAMEDNLEQPSAPLMADDVGL